MEYSWHQAQWQQLLRSYQQQRMPHALLLYGEPNLGKHDFAHLLAQRLLCFDAFNYCGKCKHCTMFLSGNHPDHIVIKPEPDSSTIAIDKIRALNHTLLMSNHSAAYQVITISLVEQLTGSSANALLKLLEEPPANTVFILITQSKDKVLATIRSRCQSVYFQAANIEQLQSYPPLSVKSLQELKLLNGAPLNAEQRLSEQYLNDKSKVEITFSNSVKGKQSLVEACASLEKMEISHVLEIICQLIQATIKHDKLATTEKSVLSSFKSSALFAMYDYVISAKKKWLANSNLNKLLFLEDLFIQCFQSVHKQTE